MRFYIIDDEIGIVKALCNIVEEEELGDICGYSTEPDVATREILTKRPDIVLVDLLMNKMDGISLVGHVKSIAPEISFVMISQVNDKDMVGSAYKNGVEFFIHKPINLIEVVNVIKNIMEHRKMNSIVANIRGMFDENTPMQRRDNLNNISRLLGFFGMTGEKGTADILAICRKCIMEDKPFSKEIIDQVAKAKDDTSKNVEQRVRRAIKKGLINVANIGLDDYTNEIFAEYATYVFDFKNIREEMDYIKGVAFGGGRINIGRFIEGVLIYNRESA